jgi:hypothetical protein
MITIFLFTIIVIYIYNVIAVTKYKLSYLMGIQIQGLNSLLQHWVPIIFYLTFYEIFRLL